MVYMIIQMAIGCYGITLEYYFALVYKLVNSYCENCD